MEHENLVRTIFQLLDSICMDHVVDYAVHDQWQPLETNGSQSLFLAEASLLLVNVQDSFGLQHVTRALNPWLTAGSFNCFDRFNLLLEEAFLVMRKELWSQKAMIASNVLLPFFSWTQNQYVQHYSSINWCCSQCVRTEWYMSTCAVTLNRILHFRCVFYVRHAGTARASVMAELSYLWAIERLDCAGVWRTYWVQAIPAVR